MALPEPLPFKYSNGGTDTFPHAKFPRGAFISSRYCERRARRKAVVKGEGVISPRPCGSMAPSNARLLFFGWAEEEGGGGLVIPVDKRRN